MCPLHQHPSHASFSGKFSIISRTLRIQNPSAYDTHIQNPSHLYPPSFTLKPWPPQDSLSHSTGFYVRPTSSTNHLLMLPVAQGVSSSQKRRSYLPRPEQAAVRRTRWHFPRQPVSSSANQEKDPLPQCLHNSTGKEKRGKKARPTPRRCSFLSATRCVLPVTQFLSFSLCLALAQDRAYGWHCFQLGRQLPSVPLTKGYSHRLLGSESNHTSLTNHRASSS